MDVFPDDIAAAITSATPDPIMKKPVVSFSGWVGARTGVKPPPADGAPPERIDGTLRLFTDPWFSRWFEIPVAEVVHQVSGKDRAFDEGRSRIWVHAAATIVQCHAAHAQYFAEGPSKQDDDDDPAAGYGGGRGKP